MLLRCKEKNFFLPAIKGGSVCHSALFPHTKKESLFTIKKMTEKMFHTSYEKNTKTCTTRNAKILPSFVMLFLFVVVIGSSLNQEKEEEGGGRRGEIGTQEEIRRRGRRKSDKWFSQPHYLHTWSKTSCSSSNSKRVRVPFSIFLVPNLLPPPPPPFHPSNQATDQATNQPTDYLTAALDTTKPSQAKARPKPKSQARPASAVCEIA